MKLIGYKFVRFTQKEYMKKNKKILKQYFSFQVVVLQQQITLSAAYSKDKRKIKGIENPKFEIKTETKNSFLADYKQINICIFLYITTLVDIYKKD